MMGRALIADTGNMLWVCQSIAGEPYVYPYDTRFWNVGQNARFENHLLKGGVYEMQIKRLHQRR